MADHFRTLTLRIDWSEIDLFGHVNNVAIMKYVQAARVDFLEALGLMQQKAETGIGPILASVSCRFMRPLFYPGHVSTSARAAAVGTTSFEIRYELRDDGGKLAARATDIIVLFDFMKQTKVPLSRALKEMILNL
ncbi:MAG TPA: acyl-CoA thioesterase [Acidobacteriota bacterium]|nr:acyl-CoA thioesterase [Acidobacteriota bacterium]HQF87487.1 acyl-CoA thioesterase [Acidobacteriota bacterium]HQG93385.1 acyl-CoA thioesterase [Acidobacteriota bacterium]HQK87415.1 acyl-CoA thioesterase [Acidobacteriota bacterium]